MARARSAPRLPLGRILLILALLAALVLIFAPAAVASGAGRLLGDLWISVMGAIVGLFGG